MVKEKPQISFISILHKIKDLYQKYDDINTEEDLENLIYFYEKKEDYSNKDLQKLQLKCSEEWGNVLIALCESIKKKIGKSKNKQKLFGANVLIVCHRCYRCQHTWVPRNIGEIPEICPKCKSPYWNKPKTRFLKTDKKGGKKNGK